MYGDLKLTWMRKVVQEYLDDVTATMEREVRKRAYDTGESASSIHGLAEGEGSTVTGKLSFMNTLRFVDMGVGRGQPVSGIKATRQALKGKKTREDGTKPRLPVKIYGKIAYGKLWYMHNKLLYGFGEEAIAAMKLELEAANQQ